MQTATTTARIIDPRAFVNNRMPLSPALETILQSARRQYGEIARLAEQRTRTVYALLWAYCLTTVGGTESAINDALDRVGQSIARTGRKELEELLMIAGLPETIGQRITARLWSINNPRPYPDHDISRQTTETFYFHSKPVSMRRSKPYWDADYYHCEQGRRRDVEDQFFTKSRRRNRRRIHNTLRDLRKHALEISAYDN